MSTLEGQSINQTYKDLLQVSNSNSGVDGTLRAVEDGEGTVSALEISTTDVRVSNLTVTGTVTGLPSSATNLSTTANGTSLTVNSDTGTNASIPAASTSAWGAMTDEDKTKLNGIDTGATANDTDANLKNRANHTGTQAASTISDFDTEVANNTAVQANTAKVGITTAQANAIVANTAKVGITTAQANAITANTAKVGITTTQANAIVANTAKVSNATHTGDVTGSGELTIGNGKVTAAKLSSTDTELNYVNGGVGIGILNESGYDLTAAKVKLKGTATQLFFEDTDEAGTPTEVAISLNAKALRFGFQDAPNTQALAVFGRNITLAGGTVAEMNALTAADGALHGQVAVVSNGNSGSICLAMYTGVAGSGGSWKVLATPGSAISA